MDYKKVEGKQSGAGRVEIVWNPNDRQAGEFIEGILIEKKEGIGVNKSRIYLIEQADKIVYAIWGTTVLDNKMAEVGVGNAVKVVYLGKQTSSKGRQPFHNWDVYVGTE